MKLKIFNKENCMLYFDRKDEWSIRIDISGLINFSRTLAKGMGVEDKSRVFFLLDLKNKKNWYLCKTDDESGFVIRDEKSGIRFRNRALVTKLLGNAKRNDSIVYLIAKKPVENNGIKYFKVLTTAPKKSKMLNEKYILEN